MTIPTRTRESPLPDGEGPGARSPAGLRPAARPPAAPRLLLGVLFLGTLLAALDIALVAPALPALRAAWGVDERTASWVFTAFVLANLGGLPLMAALADRLGRRTVYLADVALFAAGTVVVATSPSWGVLLAGRVVQGLGASGIFPVAAAVVGDTYPPETRGRALGLLGAVFGVAFLIGPAAGGILLGLASWRWLFAATLPLAAVVFALGARAVPNSRAAAPPPLDAAGLALLTAALGALVAGLSGLDAGAPLLGAGRASVWVPLAVVAALLPALVWVERRAAAPIVRPALVARRAVRVACALAVGAGLAEATFVFLSGYGVAAFGLTPSEASYALLPLVAGVAVGAPVAGRLLDRVGVRAVVTGGAATLAAGMGGVAAGPAFGWHVVATVVVGVGLSGILGASLSYILLAEAAPGERTVAQGIGTLFTSVGQLAGGAALGAAAASAATPVAGYRLGFAGVAAVALALVGVARMLPARQL